MAATDGATDEDRPFWPGWAAATAQCVRFYSRLPFPSLRGEPPPGAVPDFRALPRAVPLAALIVTLPAALVLAGGYLLRLDAIIVAALSVATAVIVTGAFHEDGLADCADGLFGGYTVERRLTIMTDSRVGTFGASALALSLLLRAAMLAALLRLGIWPAMAAPLAAACWARSTALGVLALLPPAKPGGASAAVGRPTMATLALACGLSVAIALGLALGSGLPLAALALGLALGVVAVAGTGRLAVAKIGGQTGDVAGAAQQLCELAFYFGLLIVAGAPR